MNDQLPVQIPPHVGRGEARVQSETHRGIQKEKNGGAKTDWLLKLGRLLEARTLNLNPIVFKEEMLLAMPIGRINGEALDRAQQIVVRNAKRAEAARLRYQRMTPEQRKV